MFISEELWNVCVHACFSKWSSCLPAYMLMRVSVHLPVRARQVASNLSFSHMCVYLWEEGRGGGISGDDSPVFCDSGAERVLFTHFSSLGLA